MQPVYYGIEEGDYEFDSHMPYDIDLHEEAPYFDNKIPFFGLAAANSKKEDASGAGANEGMHVGSTGTGTGTGAGNVSNKHAYSSGESKDAEEKNTRRFFLNFANLPSDTIGNLMHTLRYVI
jgi:hypothetical protein